MYPDHWSWPDLLMSDRQLCGANSRAKDAGPILPKNVLFAIRTLSFSFFFRILLGFSLAVFLGCTP